MCFISSLFRNLHKSTQGKPQKSMRSPILIRVPCYSNSFITTFEEESLGNQAKRDFGFQGTKMVDNSGGEHICIQIHIYIYVYRCMCVYIYMYNLLLQSKYVMCYEMR